MSDGEPKRYTYDDFRIAIMSAAEDAQNCVYRLGSERIERMDIFDRLAILFHVGEREINEALRTAARRLEYERARK